MRENADRTVLSLWGQQRPSLHWQLAADYIAALGQSVVAELMPTRWSDAVALDEPTWVVCDERKSIRAAVRRVWPHATIYSCENHIARIGEKKLALDGHAQFSVLWWKLQRGVKDEIEW